MGLADNATMHQLKKGQGETNERLEAIHAELVRNNQLLEALIRTVRPDAHIPR